MTKQPENTSLCGHCCLSVILGIDLKTAIYMIGHKRATRPSELYRRFAHKEKRMVFLHYPEIPTGYTLVKLKVLDLKKGTTFYHWSIFYSEEMKPSLVYEPNQGAICDYSILKSDYSGVYEFTPVQYITIQECVNSGFTEYGKN